MHVRNVPSNTVKELHKVADLFESLKNFLTLTEVPEQQMQCPRYQWRVIMHGKVKQNS
jgi:hypothetical protein